MTRLEFSFQTAGEILFGAGKIKAIGEISHKLGTKALLVSGAHGFFLAEISQALETCGCSTVDMQVAVEPDLELVEEGVRKYRSNQCNLVIACGGGSVLDAGKAVAALANNPGEILDYLEVVGKGQPLLRSPSNFIAVPTTAGTGSEVTKNAVIGVPGQRVKVSLRSPKMYPSVALVDPELALDLPPEITARTGMDALTKLIEPYLSTRSNPLVDLYCREGITRVAKSLQAAFLDGSNMDARTDMAYASLLGGIALANAGLGAVHGFAGPIGGMFTAPHGSICAALLPHVFKANYEAMKVRQANHPALLKMKEISALLTGDPDAEVEDGIDWVGDLCLSLNIPGLGTYGIKRQDFPEIIAKANKAGSMKSNALALQEGELEQILSAAL